MTCPIPPDHLRPTSTEAEALASTFLAHAAECEACARVVTTLQRLDRLIATVVRGRRGILGPCPEPEALVTWMAGERSVARRLELHLVACEECRQDVIAASVATNWKRAVVAVSTRRMRLSSARLLARGSERLPARPPEEPGPAPRSPPRGGIGLLACVFALGGLLLAAAVAQASPRRTAGTEAGVSMPALESIPSARRAAQADPAPAEDSRRP